MKKITVIIIIVIILAAAGAVAWLFMSGKLAWVDNTTKPAVAKVVCGNDIVDKYNDASLLLGRNGESKLTVDTEGIKEVKTAILAKDGNKEDPTCQAILFWIGYRETDYEATKTAYEAVRKLHDQNIFPNNNIRGNEPLFTYAQVLFTISPDANKEAKVLGG